MNAQGKDRLYWALVHKREREMKCLYEVNTALLGSADLLPVEVQGTHWRISCHW